MDTISYPFWDLLKLIHASRASGDTQGFWVIAFSTFCYGKVVSLTTVFFFSNINKTSNVIIAV